MSQTLHYWVGDEEILRNMPEHLGAVPGSGAWV